MKGSNIVLYPSTVEKKAGEISSVSKMTKLDRINQIIKNIFSLACLDKYADVVEDLIFVIDDLSEVSDIFVERLLRYKFYIDLRVKYYGDFTGKHDQYAADSFTLLFQLLKDDMPFPLQLEEVTFFLNIQRELNPEFNDIHGIFIRIMEIAEGTFFEHMVAKVYLDIFAEREACIDTYVLSQIVYVCSRIDFMRDRSSTAKDICTAFQDAILLSLIKMDIRYKNEVLW